MQDDLNITNANVYNFDATYNSWIVENGRGIKDRLNGHKPETVEIF